MLTGSALMAVVVTGCSNPAFKSIGTSILTSTGVVDPQQADGIFSAGAKIAKSQQDLTAEQEYYLGRAVSAKLLAQYPPVSNAELTKYVNKVGMALAAVSDLPETFGGYRFIVVNSPHINAMSAPGGFVFVSTGFLKKLPDEDALAAVFAHEIGHVVARHGVKAITNASLFSALGDAAATGVSVAASQTSAPVDLGPITGVFSDSVNGVVDKLLTKGFDRGQEYGADLYAAQLLQRAGYDPRALARVLEILEKETSKDDSGWFQTHPDPDDRLGELEDDFTFPSPARQPSQVRLSRYVAATRSVR
jgi:predicted Zn-dependent protease